MIKHCFNNESRMWGGQCMPNYVSLCLFLSINVYFYCISSVFGITVNRTTFRWYYCVVYQHLMILFYIHNTIY